ncbi:unnamed protein product [Prorocentrum cordatum]|uniref:SET domain-containing protein n=1 Tax=Prorocentrum cordatum TaxID=2364126 RepID=A0ABN9VUB6_9DINO|nr:unnamed protein product [Polarella glacialis]|mmetsp:Transcript_51720/g.137356  ORF Transcript_51720/g.137356 Transcript_51720/m.137356 type:complete len:262 (+) Transcript_51720:72-857(+)
MATPVGCLDTDRCAFGIEALVSAVPPPSDQAGSELQMSPILEAMSPHHGVFFATVEGSVRKLSHAELEDMLGCTYIHHLIFEEEKILKQRDLWSFPPPVSPSTPFGNVPTSKKLGCDELLSNAEMRTDLVLVRHVGIVEGVDIGLGLFASLPIPANTFLGEYTGVVRKVLPVGDDISYSYALPMIDPELVIDAKKFGNLCRLINHSDTEWNSELISVEHEGLVHVVCRTVRDIKPGEQILIHYGSKYWEANSRNCVRLSPL